MVNTHTPAPWEISSKTTAVTVVSTVTGCRIAQCSKDSLPTEAQQANARLIAAAPELLGSLEELMGEYGSDDEEHLIYEISEGGEYAVMLLKALRVIKKAKGTS